MTVVIDVNHLNKSYGDFVAVEDVSFQVNKGEIFGILGPNGAGKTTTVECIQGLRDPSGGEIRVLGADAVRDRHQLRSKVGSQLQESALPDRIKVWEALDLFAAVDDTGPDWHLLMDQWGLTAKRNASFASLSGGQRQRLFVALALVNVPEVVFLDELTQGLDPSARHVAWELIRAIRDRGATVVIVTHYMDEAEDLCDRLAVVDGGRVIATGSPQELIASDRRGVEIRFSTGETDLTWLERVEGVTSVSRDHARVSVRGTGPAVPLAISSLVQHGIVPTDLRVVQPRLEDIYFDLINTRKEGATHAYAG